MSMMGRRLDGDVELLREAILQGVC